MKSSFVFAVILIVAFAFFTTSEAQPVEDAERCPQNEDYWPCAYSCQIRCDNYQNPGDKQRIPEQHRCPGDCYCKKGFARNEAGICIPIDQC